jgi:hypothetical protein
LSTGFAETCGKYQYWAQELMVMLIVVLVHPADHQQFANRILTTSSNLVLKWVRMLAYMYKQHFDIIVCREYSIL